MRSLLSDEILKLSYWNVLVMKACFPFYLLQRCDKVITKAQRAGANPFTFVSLLRDERMDGSFSGASGTSFHLHWEPVLIKYLVIVGP